jgi:hypothetical protein
MFGRRRFAWLCACAVLLTMPLAACRDKNADLATKNPRAAMAAASRRTRDAKTVRLSLTAKTQAGVAVLSGSGAYDFTTRDGRFKLSTASGAGVEMIVTPKTTFVKLPANAPEGKPWVSLPQAELASAAETGSAFTVSLVQELRDLRGEVDPRSTLDALGADVPDLHKVGTQNVRGTATTHLAGRVDLSNKAIAAAPASRKAALQKARATFGPNGYPVGVWLDRDGRVRRVEYAVTSGPAGQQTSTTVRLDLYAFGGKTGIVIPKPGDVADGARLLNPSTTTAPK